MIDSTALNVAERFGEFLSKVQQGETIRVFQNGKPVAKIVPEAQHMSGREAAALFRGLIPDPETADAIQLELKKLQTEAENALDH